MKLEIGFSLFPSLQLILFSVYWEKSDGTRHRTAWVRHENLRRVGDSV
jgi:hypothetical protein